MSLLKFFKRKQTTQKSEQIEGIDFKFRKNPLSKCVKITLKSDKSVLVTMPRRASFDYARKFALKNIVDIKSAIKNIAPSKYIYKGIEYSERNDLIKILRKDAKEYLPKRLEELAQKFGYRYKRVALKLMKTRWGSCSYKNNINLNISLMTLEEELIDYVLLHELVHTVEKNHGDGFYSRLLLHMPDAGCRQKILKSRKVI